MKRILIVDDQPILLHALQAFFELEGYWCQVASQGGEALAFLEREPAVDVIITDNDMPVMDGLEFILHLKNSVVFRDIPIILHTGSVLAKEKKDFFQKSCIAILDKPTGFSELGLVVAQALDFESPQLRAAERIFA